MEHADMHLSSMSHITTYLVVFYLYELFRQLCFIVQDEFHSSKTGSLQMDGDRLKVFEDIKQICDGILEEQGESVEL